MSVSKEVTIYVKSKSQKGQFNESPAIEVDVPFRHSKMDVSYFALFLTKTNAYLSVEDIGRIMEQDFSKHEDAVSYDDRALMAFGELKRMFNSNKITKFIPYLMIEESVERMKVKMKEG